MNKTYCPMNENCLATNVIYEATINANLPNYQEKKYIGLCESTFKKRFANHKSSFNHEGYKNSTSLSVELWKIKEENGTPTVTWQIVRKANAYTPVKAPFAMLEREIQDSKLPCWKKPAEQVYGNEYYCIKICDIPQKQLCDIPQNCKSTATEILERVTACPKLP